MAVAAQDHGPRVNESIRQDRAIFDQMPMAIDALLQVLAVGSGASLGREQAPRLFAAASTELMIRSGTHPSAASVASCSPAPPAPALPRSTTCPRRACCSPRHRAESWRPLAVLVAVATSCIATVTAWPISHGDPTFVWPDTDYNWTALLFTIALMPLAALVGTGFNGLIDTRSRSRRRNRRRSSSPIGLAGLLTGTCSIWMPQMPGNGKSIILETLTGGDTLIAVTVAMVLKPVLTALFIRAGAVGGMLTPALSTGVATGAFVALAVNRLGGHASVPTLALIGGAAVLGITQHAPVFAAVFTAELTHPPTADLEHAAAGRGRRPRHPRRGHPPAQRTAQSPGRALTSPL